MAKRPVVCESNRLTHSDHHSVSERRRHHPRHQASSQSQPSEGGQAMPREELSHDGAATLQIDNANR